MNKNKIKDILKEKNISITQNRIEIIQCLSDDVHFHTVKDILSHTKGLNTKSIYNNLKALIDAGIVETYSFDGISKYALNDSISDLNHENQIHIMGKEDVINHHSVNPKIFQSIKKELKNYNIKNIKIFVELKK